MPSVAPTCLSHARLPPYRRLRCDFTRASYASCTDGRVLSPLLTQSTGVHWTWVGGHRNRSMASGDGVRSSATLTGSLVIQGRRPAAEERRAVHDRPACAWHHTWGRRCLVHEADDIRAQSPRAPRRRPSLGSRSTFTRPQYRYLRRSLHGWYTRLSCALYLLCSLV